MAKISSFLPGVIAKTCLKVLIEVRVSINGKDLIEEFWTCNLAQSRKYLLFVIKLFSNEIETEMGKI